MKKIPELLMDVSIMAILLALLLLGSVQLQQ